MNRHSERQCRDDWNNCYEDEKRGSLEAVSENRDNRYGEPLSTLQWDRLPKAVRRKLMRLFDSVAPCVLGDWDHETVCKNNL